MWSVFSLFRLFSFSTRGERDVMPGDACVHMQVKRPMSLDVVEAKLSACQYSGAVEFANDMLLMLSNATLYNGKDSKIGQAALQLQTLFKSECAKCPSLSTACMSAAATQGSDNTAREPGDGDSQQDEAKPSTLLQECAADAAGSRAKETPQLKALQTALALTQPASGRTSISKVTKAALSKLESHTSGKVLVTHAHDAQRSSLSSLSVLCDTGVDSTVASTLRTYAILHVICAKTVKVGGPLAHRDLVALVDALKSNRFQPHARNPRPYFVFCLLLLPQRCCGCTCCLTMPHVFVWPVQLDGGARLGWLRDRG